MPHNDEFANRRSITYRNGFQSLVASISRRFAGPPLPEDPAERTIALDALLNSTIRETGEFLGADRGNILLLESHGAAFSCTHAWNDDGVESVQQDLQHVPFDRFPWIRDHLFALAPVSIPDVKELPPAADVERRQLEALKVQSLLLVPMVGRGELVGFFGFDMVRSRRNWEQVDAELLQIVAEMIAGALMRHQDLNALQESEERLRLTLEATTDGMWDYDILDSSLLLSDSAARMLGLESRRIDDCPGFMLNRIHPDDVEHVEKRYLEHLEGKAQRFEAEFRIALPGGEWLRLVARGMVVGWRGTEPARMLGSIMDVGEVRRAELSRRETEEKYRQLFEMEKDAIFVIDDADDIILEANAATEDMYGYSREYLLGMKFGDLSQDQADLKDPAAIHGNGTSMVVQTHVHCDGSPIPVEISMRRIPWQEKVVRIAAVRDISERYEAQQALESQRQFLKGVIEAAPSMIVVRDRSRRVIFVNAAVCRFHGRSENEMLGHTGLELLPSLYSSPAFSEEDDALYTGRMERVDGEYKLQDSRGETRWLRIIRLPLRNPEGLVNAVLSVGIDLTEEKQLKAELVRTGQLASLGELAAGLAHEINNPVNGIINYAQVLLDMMEDGGQMDAGGAQFLHKIISEGERIAHLSHGVLGFSRSHASEKPPCAVDSAIYATIDLVSSRLRRDGVNLTLDVPENLPLADCVTWKLQQVLMNLVSNARFALNERYPAPDPGKELIIAARQESSAEGQKVIITVEDRGTGIDPELMNDIFDPFFTTKPEGEGTGLGLSICLSILQDFQGSLVLEQPEQGGARAVVTLAAADGAPAGMTC